MQLELLDLNRVEREGNIGKRGEGPCDKGRFQSVVEGRIKSIAKKGVSWKGEEFRSLWATRIYIFISVFLAVKQGHRKSQRKRSPIARLLLRLIYKDVAHNNWTN